MKRIIAITVCVMFVLSALFMTSCGCNSGKEKGVGKTVISQVDQKDATSAKPAKSIIHGRVSGDAAPEGWAIKSDEGGDFITYIKMTGDYATDPDKCPYVQISCDEMSADDLFTSVCTLKDTKGLSYATDSVTIGEVPFLGIFVDGDANSLFGTVDGNTMVINYRDVNIDDPDVTKIIGGIEIASEK